MTKYDESEGKWRTVGGRRIFIKSGQSLSDAMKKSGKFKNKNQKKQMSYEDKEKRMEELAEKMDKMTDEGKDDSPEFEKMAEEYDRLMEENKQEDTDFLNQKSEDTKLNEDEVTTKAQWKEDYGDDIESLERDLKESEMYLDEDAEGYAEAKKSLENGKEYLEELKKSKKENDPYSKDRLDRIKNALNDGALNQEQENNALKDFRKISGGKRPDEVYNIEDGKYTSRKDDKESNTYKKAFEEYKKKHPNTKLTLNKFIDLSEGK